MLFFGIIGKYVLKSDRLLRSMVKQIGTLSIGANNNQHNVTLSNESYATDSSPSNRVVLIPDWGKAVVQWGAAWDLHLVVFSFLFLLQVFVAISVCLRFCRKTCRIGMILYILICVECAAALRFAFFVVDPYGYNGSLSGVVTHLWVQSFNPLACASYGLMQLVIVKITGMEIMSVKLLRHQCAVFSIMTVCSVCMLLVHGAVLLDPRLKPLLLLDACLAVIWMMFMCVAFICSGFRLSQYAHEARQAKKEFLFRQRRRVLGSTTQSDNTCLRSCWDRVWGPIYKSFPGSCLQKLGRSRECLAERYWKVRDRQRWRLNDTDRQQLHQNKDVSIETVPQPSPEEIKRRSFCSSLGSMSGALSSSRGCVYCEGRKQISKYKRKRKKHRSLHRHQASAGSDKEASMACSEDKSCRATAELEKDNNLYEDDPQLLASTCTCILHPELPPASVLHRDKENITVEDDCRNPDGNVSKGFSPCTQYAPEQESDSRITHFSLGSDSDRTKDNSNTPNDTEKCTNTCYLCNPLTKSVERIDDCMEENKEEDVKHSNGVSSEFNYPGTTVTGPTSPDREHGPCSPGTDNNHPGGKKSMPRPQRVAEYMNNCSSESDSCTIRSKWRDTCLSEDPPDCDTSEQNSNDHALSRVCIPIEVECLSVGFKCQENTDKRSVVLEEKKGDLTFKKGVFSFNENQCSCDQRFHRKGRRQRSDDVMYNACSGVQNMHTTHFSCLNTPSIEREVKSSSYGCDSRGKYEQKTVSMCASPRVFRQVGCCCRFKKFKMTVAQGWCVPVVDCRPVFHVLWCCFRGSSDTDGRSLSSQCSVCIDDGYMADNEHQDSPFVLSKKVHPRTPSLSKHFLPCPLPLKRIISQNYSASRHSRHEPRVGGSMPEQGSPSSGKPALKGRRCNPSWRRDVETTANIVHSETTFTLLPGDESCAEDCSESAASKVFHVGSRGKDSVEISSCSESDSCLSLPLKQRKKVLQPKDGTRKTVSTSSDDSFVQMYLHSKSRVQTSLENVQSVESLHQSYGRAHVQNSSTSGTLLLIRRAGLVSKVVQGTYILTFLHMFLCLLQLYRAFGRYGVLWSGGEGSVDSEGHESVVAIPSAWPWLTFQSLCRVTEAASGYVTIAVLFIILRHRNRRRR